MDKISIITITKDNYPDLEFTLNSLSHFKTNSDIEIVVVDSSEHPNYNVINNLKVEFHNIKFVFESRKGISLAFNVGIENVTGKWVFFLNSGDVLINPEALWRLRADISDKINVCYGVSEIYDSTINKVIGRQGRVIENWPPLRMPFNHQSVLYRKTLFDNKGKYSLEYKLAMDYEHLLRCNQEEILFVPCVVSRFFIGGTSSNKGRVYDEWLKALLNIGYSPFKAYMVHYYFKLRLIARNILTN